VTLFRMMLSLVALLIAGSAAAQNQTPKTNRDLLNDLQADVPAASRVITIPSPNTTATVPSIERSIGPDDSGERALKNLKEEQSLRIQQEIREKLPE